ncbi:MAG: DUF460 domain-containing protein [Pyrobaculum sp.]
MAILGIDIAPGGSFGYALWEEGKIIEKGTTDVKELAKLFKKYKIETLAVDNVGELFQYAKVLVKLLGKLPYVVDVVEVTRTQNGGFRKVEELVGEFFNIEIGRINPEETAFYLALLASRGVGTPVKLFEEETVVLVYRRISTTPGGMSRNRYMRNITHRIKSTASKIETRLKEARLDYDLFIKEESGEVTSAKFIVYANREVVRRYVKPMRSVDIAIAVYSTPARRSREPTTNRYLILGVDPGVVTGLAILTLDGDVLDTVARRSFSRGDILRYVHQWGVPVVVATDVKEPPEFVKKLAAMCGSVLYSPGRDLTTEEKSQILQKTKWRASTSHERDALAAAYKAYLEYKPKFEKITREFGNILKFDQVEYAKALVVRGFSIAQAVSEALKKRDEEKTRVIYVTIEKPCVKHDDFLQSRVKALEYENKKLFEELENLRHEYIKIKRQLEDEKWRDVKYRELQTRIDNLIQILHEKERELSKFKELVLDILLNFGSKYRLVHSDELFECKGGEEVGVICRNLTTIEESVARRSLGVPLNLVAVLQLKDFYVIDLDAVRQCQEEIKRKLDGNKPLDLKKLLEQYRRGLI